MSDAWRVASINSFEQVPVATSSGLLRVSAQSAFRSRPDDLRPTLVADDGSTVSRFAAIPAPPDSGGILRAAFSVPVDVATPDTVFSLEFEDGFVIALPDPSPGAARINRRVSPAPIQPPALHPSPAGDESPASAAPAADATESPARAADPAASDGPEGEERRSELQPKITELTEELAEARRQVAELRDDADFGARARDTILGMLSTAALAHAELRAAHDLQTHTPPVPVAAEDDTHADVRGLEDRVVALESESRGHLDRVTVAERERDEAHEARRQAENSVEPLTAARARAERELAEAQDQLHKMGMERDELSRQAHAFDGVAIKARERAAEAEAGHQKASGRLNELEVWTGELERRLSETTTQLGEARTAALADESELRRLRALVQEPPLATSDPAPAAHTTSQTRSVTDSQLDDIRRAALSEAHAQASRDLADASSNGRS